MARMVNWEEFKEYVHAQGVTIKALAEAARVSVSTLRRCYNGEVDKELDNHVMYVLRKEMRA